MESITDWAFSWPISVVVRLVMGEMEEGRGSCTLVVVDDVAEVVSSAVVRFADAH